MAELRQILDRLADPIISNVVGGWFGAQVEVITDVLLDEPVAVMTANHRIRQIDILDYGLQFATVVFGYLPAEDGGDLVGLADGAIGVQETLAQLSLATSFGPLWPRDLAHQSNRTG